MALKITKENEPIQVDTIITCLYSPPGTGKTTLAQSAESPLTFDFDNGIHRAGFRKDVVRVQEWSEVANLSADDLAGYKTIIVDTAGRALDMLAMHLIKEDSKMGTTAGALSLKGYGQLKAVFSGWLNRLKLMGKDIVMLSHMSEEKDGDKTLERLDIQGGSKGEIYKSADLMGRISMAQGGGRTLDFSPSETRFGKNPASFPLLKVPDIKSDQAFLATVLRDAKAALNSMSEGQKVLMQVLGDWQHLVNLAETGEQFTTLSESVASATEKAPDQLANCKRILLTGAKAKGFEYSKAEGKFVAVTPVEA